MAGTVNADDACQAIKDIIEADSGAILDAIDTAYSATGAEVLDDIAKVWLAPQERHQQLPALTVVAAETEWDQEAGEKEGIYQHRIVLELVLRGNNRTTDYAPEELLTVKIQRTVRGLVETLEAKRRLTVSGTNHADYLAFESVAYSELDASGAQIEKRAEMSFLVLVST